nr:hypothetical protein [Tanacetum cinerariifolium]GEW93565.1 hypothetical protein [Tanacetum cinerariifolium]
MAAAQNINNSNLKSILTSEKLTRPNFMNWHRNIRIALRYEKKLVRLEQPLQPALDPATATQEAVDAYYELVSAQQEVVFLMLDSMSPNLQKTVENYNAYDMLQELKVMFEEQAKQELFKIVKAFHACKQEDGQSNMHRMGKTIVELHAMLKLTEKGLPKKAETPAIPLPPKRGNLTKDFIYHYYKEVGHWRRKCLAYLGELKKKKNTSVASTLVLYTMLAIKELNVCWNLLIFGIVVLVISTRSAFKSFNMMGSCNPLMMNVLKNANLRYLEIWRAILLHIKWKELKNYLDLYTLMYVALLELCKEKVLITSKRLLMILAVMGFDLKSDACIFNMVPTKMIDRKPYEEMIDYYFYYPLENKIFVARNVEFFGNSLTLQEASDSNTLQEASGSDVCLELL